MNPDTVLPTRHLKAGTSIAQAHPWQYEPVTLASPALEVMTDLTQFKAASAMPSISLEQAEQKMIYLGVRTLFVVEDMPKILGLVTSTDLQGDKPLRLIEERRLARDRIMIADVMTPLADLDAIDFDSLRFASVSNLVATLKSFGRSHLLVVESPAEGPERVRGVISRAQIERQLGQRLEMTEVATNFAELGKMLS